MRSFALSVALSLACTWAAGLEAKPVVIDLTIYEARTSSMGNITGTSALFRVTTDTQLMTIDGFGRVMMPASFVDVTVFGTPIGTIHGVISMPGIEVIVTPTTGEIDIHMPLAIVTTSQGIRGVVPALNGYAFQASMTASPVQTGATYVNGLPVSSRLFWTPDIPGVGPLGAGGIPPVPIPAGTLAISILDAAPVPATSPTLLAVMGLGLLVWGLVAVGRYQR